MMNGHKPTIHWPCNRCGGQVSPSMGHNCHVPPSSAADTDYSARWTLFALLFLVGGNLLVAAAAYVLRDGDKIFATIRSLL